MVRIVRMTMKYEDIENFIFSSVKFIFSSILLRLMISDDADDNEDDYDDNAMKYEDTQKYFQGLGCSRLTQVVIASHIP